MIVCHFSDKVDHHTAVPELTADEECILQYAAGYVPFKLLKRHEKNLTSSNGTIECLSSMAIDGDESNLLEYTTKWTKTVNRGGLFEISDTTYMLFKEIEMKIRKHLFLIFERKSLDDNQRGTIVSAAANEVIQFYWTLLSCDIENEEEALTLLKEIIGLWLNIRGFSIAGGWIEEYRKVTKSKSSMSK